MFIHFDFERHTHLSIKRSNSWNCISEQKPSHEVKGTACSGQWQDCVETQIWGWLQKYFAALNVHSTALHGTVFLIPLNFSDHYHPLLPPPTNVLLQICRNSEKYSDIRGMLNVWNNRDKTLCLIKLTIR